MRKLLFLIVIAIDIAAILKSPGLCSRLGHACGRMWGMCGCPMCRQDGEVEDLPTEEAAEATQEST